MLKRNLQQFAWFIKYYRKQYIISIFCIFISYGFTMMPARFVGVLTDRVISKSIDMRGLFGYLALLFLLILLNYGLTFIWGYFIYRAADEITRLSAKRIFKQLLRQGPHFFARNTTGSLMGKATNDVEALADFAGFGCMAFFDASAWPLALFVVMLLISWRLALLAVLPLPFLIVISKMIGTRLYAYYDRAQESFDRMNQAVLEGVAGIRVVRAYHLEDSETHFFGEKADDLFRKNMQAVTFSQLYAPVSRIISGLAFVIAIGFGLFEISAGRLTVGKLLTFSFYLGMLTWPMISIGEFMISAQQGSASAERIDDLLREKVDVDEEQLTEAMPLHTGLEVRDFSFRYPDLEKGDESKALSHISFSLEEGKTLGLVGPVGCGKSTLLRQFQHFYPLPAETLFVGGKDLSKIRRSELREAIAYVPQSSYLFSQSIRDNILLGASSEEIADGSAAQRLEEVLDIADLRKDLPMLPQGLDSPAGEKGLALSGGQKQRICIARALMKNSPILVLDDCLSAVDAFTEERILDGLRRESSGRTTLIAAHRLSAVNRADLILVMDRGQLVDSGTHAELLARGGWYAEQYQQQQLEREEKEDANGSSNQ